MSYTTTTIVELIANNDTVYDANLLYNILGVEVPYNTLNRLKIFGFETLKVDTVKSPNDNFLLRLIVNGNTIYEREYERTLTFNQLKMFAELQDFMINGVSPHPLVFQVYNKEA